MRPALALLLEPGRCSRQATRLCTCWISTLPNARCCCRVLRLALLDRVGPDLRRHDAGSRASCERAAERRLGGAVHRRRVEDGRARSERRADDVGRRAVHRRGTCCRSRARRPGRGAALPSPQPGIGRDARRRTPSRRTTGRRRRAAHVDRARGPSRHHPSRRRRTSTASPSDASRSRPPGHATSRAPRMSRSAERVW